jgi:mono/diheme cytochrome c family protein
MKRRKFSIARALFTFAATILTLAASARAQDAPALFKARCSVCHGADGSGNSAMGKTLGAPDLHSEAVQKQTDAQLIDAITNGVGKKMPAFKDKLTDAQIKNLVGYIRDLVRKQ